MARKLPLPRGWKRRAMSSILHGHWDSYPAATAFAGAGLSPAGTTDPCTAHVDQYSSFGEPRPPFTLFLYAFGFRWRPWVRTWRKARSMSVSERMPTSFPSSTTGRAPTFFSQSMPTAS